MGEREGTIAAIATPPGPAERGVVRLSGDDAGALVARAFRSEPPFTPDAPRGSYAGRLDDGVGTQPCLLWWMPGPASYTAEDVAELHLPGSPPLVAAALERVLALGARAAAPGEFTRRAFAHGRIDLTRAEAVLALTAAANERERRAATRLLVGGLDGRLAAIREALAELRALAEAGLDFDEDDAGHVEPATLLALGGAAGERLDEALAWETHRQPPGHLPRVALVGAPNAGKSALFVALTGERALVSDVAGTTRDPLVGLWRVGDADVLLVDTAGEHAPGSAAEERALALARREREAADLVLGVVDAASSAAAPDGADVVVWNQVDRGHAGPSPADAVPTSAATGAGLAALAAAVERALGRDAAPADAARELSARHRAALVEARRALDEALRACAAGVAPDLVAGGLREATDALDAIAGRTTPEDLLDRIFARFCLGK